MSEDSAEDPQYTVTYLVDGDCSTTSKFISRGGRARVTYQNGDVYEGDFSNTSKKKHGKGTYIFASSSEEDDSESINTTKPMKYTGQYVSGMRQGHGTFTFPDGASYTGQFLFNAFQGLGTYTYANGDIYSGMWKNGKRHGSGTYVVKATESQLVGTWKDSELVRGTWHARDGTTFEGSLPGIHSSPFQGVFRFPHSSLKHKGEYLVDGDGDEDDESKNVKWKSESSENDQDGELSSFSSSSSSVPLKQESFQNLCLVSFDPNGSVVLRVKVDGEENEEKAEDESTGEEKTVSLQGLSVSLFSSDDKEISKFTIREEIDLSSKTHLRLLFDNHARDPPEFEKKVLDMCMKGLKSGDENQSVRFSFDDDNNTRVWLSLEDESKNKKEEETKESEEEQEKKEEGDDDDGES